MLESAAVRALLLSLAAGLSTLLGALVVFAARRRSEKLLAVSLGFAEMCIRDRACTEQIDPRP